MTPTADDIAELKRYCSTLEMAEEGGTKYYRLSGLKLPSSCKQSVCDALFCPTAVAGYPSRLFFSEKVDTPHTLNWNFLGQTILAAPWWAFSFQVNEAVGTFANLFKAHYSGLVRAAA